MIGVYGDRHVDGSLGRVTVPGHGADMRFLLTNPLPEDHTLRVILGAACISVIRDDVLAGQIAVQMGRDVPDVRTRARIILGRLGRNVD